MADPQPRSLTGARWTLRPADTAAEQRLREALGVSGLTARVLACRGLTSPEGAGRFLDSDLGDLGDPFAMADMERAVAAVQGALARGAHIRVYGDYDVDGVCATALVVRALKALGADIDWYIPHRLDEGYGLNEEAVRQAREEGVDLLITVDCGSTAAGPIAAAKELGLEVVVTDHHRLGDELPDAPVLNPCRADCGYPYKDLAGVGVAFKLVTALGRSLGLPQGEELNFLDLVCLGTVADVVPLLGENRLLVQHGLRRLSESRKAGVRALIAAAGVRDGKELGVRAVAFGLAPRINAAGRMEDARAAVRLMLTTDPEEARELAAGLCAHNEARQVEERRTLGEAEAMVASGVDLGREKVIVLGSEGWHPGVIGIVASRLVERHRRPALLVAISDGAGKGSGRSIAAFNLWEALRECSPVLQRFGGHRFAAGFGVQADRLAELRERINTLADALLTADDLCRCIEVDAEAELGDLTQTAVSELSRLAPFGMGNPAPVMVARRLRVETAKRVGDGSHLSLRVRGEGTGSMGAIWFRAGEAAAELGSGAEIDACFRPRLDEWNGQVRVQLQVEDIGVRDG